MTTYDKGQPTTPQFIKAATFSQDSWRGAEKTYTQDLSNRTCSCGDFTYRRSGKAMSDPERLCKHLALILTGEIR